MARTMLTETPDLHGAFPRLSPGHLTALETAGEVRDTHAEDVLVREGDTPSDFVVVLSGLVETLEGSGPQQRSMGLHGPRRFLGDLNLLTGQPSFLTAVVREPGEVLAVSVDQLREAVTEDSSLGDLILRAYLSRRWLLLELGTGVRVIGSRFSPDTRRLRQFLARNRIPHRWVDLEEDTNAEDLLRQLRVGPEDTPIVIWRDHLLRRPDDATMARVLGLAESTPPRDIVDVVVIGAGPAGLAASVYAASEGLNTVTLDAVATGGQAGTSSLIENYPGFPAGISGAELADRALIQARKFGARISVPAAATSLELDDTVHRVGLADGGVVRARAVVLATGVRYRRLEVPGLEAFEGSSVHYAATTVEAQVCRDQPVAVVGGGNSAAQAALFLVRRVSRLHLLVRETDLGEHMSRYLVERIERTPQIEVLLHTEVREAMGTTALEGLVVEDLETKARQQVPARAVFVFIGAEPQTGWLEEAVALDDHGFVLTGQAARPPQSSTEGRAPALLETSRPGVFAAGDVRAECVKRVGSAVGDGAAAIRFVHEHLERTGGSSTG